MRIAVVGFGMGGSALAWRLGAGGHEVVVFEQAKTTGPVGAGILLQPNGQAVLGHFGMLDEVEAIGTPISGLDAKHRSGRRLTTLDYGVLSAGLHGIGVMRSELFALFEQRCADVGVEIRHDRRITSYRHVEGGVHPIADDGEEMEAFDLLVASDGSGSALRSHAVATNPSLRVETKEYEYGAMWMAAPYAGDPERLVQVVDRSGRLIGMLPVGGGRCSFFWGIRLEEQEVIKANGLESWQRSVAEFLPEAGELAASITSLDEATFSTYRTVRMLSAIDGRVVFVGDAAHATSPHLGQGLNLALVDAVVLAEELDRTIDDRANVHEALSAYEHRRGPTTRYYTQLTGFLTPFFQTSNVALRAMRDAALPVMPYVPGLRAHMVLTMSGLKRSWLFPARPSTGVRVDPPHWSVGRSLRAVRPPRRRG